MIKIQIYKNPTSYKLNNMLSKYVLLSSKHAINTVTQNLLLIYKKTYYNR